MSSSSVNQAIESGNKEFLKECMERNDPKLFQADSNGLFPVHYACAFGNEEILSYIIKNSSEAPNAIFGHKTATSGTTPLHYAARNGHLEVVRILVKDGADINSRDVKGWTPLHYACYRGFCDVAELLIESGADVSAHTEDDGRYTPLHFACYSGYSSVIFSLIKNGADLTEADAKGEFPFDMLPITASTLTQPPPPQSQQSSLLSTLSPIYSQQQQQPTPTLTPQPITPTPGPITTSSKRSKHYPQPSNPAIDGPNALNMTYSELLKESYTTFKKDIHSYTLLDNGLHSDVTVVTEATGAQLKAHKAILAARSPKIAAELAADPNSTKISIPGTFSEAAVRMFLQWCYTGDLSDTTLTPETLKGCAQLIDLAQLYLGNEENPSENDTFCGLPDLSIAYIATKIKNKSDVMNIADSITLLKPSRWVGKLGAVMIERSLTLPAVDSLVYVYQSLKKLPLDTLELVISDMRLVQRESLHANSAVGDGDSGAPSGVSSPAIGPAAQGPAQPSSLGTVVSAPVVAPSLVPELFVLEYAKMCPPEFKRKIKATDNKMGSIYNLLLSESNMEGCIKMIRTLETMKDAIWFKEPVSEAPGYAPNYYNIVKHPMDFTTLEVKKDIYTFTYIHFLDLCLLVFEEQKNNYLFLLVVATIIFSYLKITFF